MNKKIIVSYTLATLLSLPILTLAAFSAGSVPGQHTFNQVIDGVVAVLWPLLVAATVIIFFLAAFQMVTAAGDAAKVEAARNTFIYGVVGVILSIIAISIPTIVKTLSGL